MRDAESFRPRHIECANSYCFRGRIEYCMRESCRDGKRDASPGKILRGRRLGTWREAPPGQADTPGREKRARPTIMPDPRGYEKIAPERNFRRGTHRSVPHTIAWKANGDVGGLRLRSDPASPGPSEIASVCKYLLFYGCKCDEQPKIQRQIWRDAVRGYDERCEGNAICTKLQNTTVARRMISKADCMVGAANLHLRG